MVAGLGKPANVEIGCELLTTLLSVLGHAGARCAHVQPAHAERKQIPSTDSTVSMGIVAWLGYADNVGRMVTGRHG